MPGHAGDRTGAAGDHPPGGSPGPSLAFVFVCQSGRIEINALMLALSLRRFVDGDTELIAAVPTPASRWGTPRREILDHLERLQVRIVEIENHFGSEYAIGNKISCMMVPTRADKLVFVDSDVLCLRPFEIPPEFSQPVAAKPVDRATIGLDEETWRLAYATVGLDLPTERVTSTVSAETMPPYYNSGFLAVDSGVGFGDAWLECCLAIDADPRVEPKRPWLDQLGLPVAAAKLGLTVGQLTERHNFPAHLRRMDPDDPPIMCHYHQPRHLVRSPCGATAVRRLGDEHPFVWELMGSDPAWRRVARLGQPPLRRRAAAVPGVRAAKASVDRAADGWFAGRIAPTELDRDAIVTGFPRSGTSLFSTLLNSIPNAVCLNEIGSPAQTFRSFHAIRRRISTGRPVPNKYDRSGSLVTDTSVGGVRRDRRVIDVDDHRFVLAQKSTLPYLARLEELCDRGISVWVLVRHPLFAIDSWKRSPPHFGIAQIDPPGPWLAHIPMPTDDHDERRVIIWNHFAREIDRLRERVQIVRYEDLVDHPARELGRFCGHFGLQPPETVPELSSRNRDRAAMAPEFVDLITERCELSLFGYE